MDKKHRIFSTSFKEEKVREIESKQITISELSRLYEVSHTAIYKWIYKYGKTQKRGERMVVEKESESFKRLELEKKVAELEQMFGRKQVEIEYLNKIIEEGDKLLGTSLKKKCDPKS